MNVKAKAIEALRTYECPDTLWYLLNKWKKKGELPFADFSVLITGPPETYKERIVKRFKELWPHCRPVTRDTTSRFQDWAGYDLVLQTHVLIRVVNNTATHWEHATVVKSRWFVIDKDFYAL